MRARITCVQQPHSSLSNSPFCPMTLNNPCGASTVPISVRPISNAPPCFSHASTPIISSLMLPPRYTFRSCPHSPRTATRLSGLKSLTPRTTPHWRQSSLTFESFNFVPDSHLAGSASFTCRCMLPSQKYLWASGWASPRRTFASLRPRCRLSPASRGQRRRCGYPCGVVFEITPVGKLTTLHKFDQTDGAVPTGALVQAANGNLYGTTDSGGFLNCNLGSTPGCGTVFEINLAGVLTTLYSFCPRGFPCTDGSKPMAGLVQATNGKLYGTTYMDGLADCPFYDTGCGTVFEITPTGTLTTLYSFCSQSGCTDGELPTAALVQATNGNLYGTTLGGGANGYGTVFKITPTGTLTMLYSFCSQSSCTDGAEPQAGLVQATDGNFYGMTQYGGTEYGGNGCLVIGGCGTVFKITPSGTLTTLYIFCSQSGCTDGEYPSGGLVQATDGNL